MCCKTIGKTQNFQMRQRLCVLHVHQQLTTGAKPVLYPNCMIPYIKKSNSDPDNTLPTHFKRPKNQKSMSNMYNLKISLNVLSTCMPNFKSQSFKIKEIFFTVLSISSVYFYSEIYWSRQLCGFLPLMAAKFRLVW